MTNNQKFGRQVANIVYRFGLDKCPFILNKQQADAFYERYNELKHVKYVNR